jgi:hypothetical protein
VRDSWKLRINFRVKRGKRGDRVERGRGRVQHPESFF